MHATVTVGEMMEALQRIAADREKRQEEEDEALIKSIVFHNSKGYVKRIRDEDLEDDELLVHLSKKQKNSEDLPGKATDLLLTKASFYASRTWENSRRGGKLNSLVITIIKKPVISDVISPAEPEQKEQEEDDKTNTINGLRSLIANYESDED